MLGRLYDYDEERVSPLIVPAERSGRKGPESVERSKKDRGLETPEGRAG